MVSFWRFLTSLLVLTTMAAVVAQDATPTTNTTAATPQVPDELMTKCSTEFNAILVCLTSKGVNGTNFDDANVATTCNECFATTQALGQSDVVGKPCTEVQGLVDDALVECAPQCQLDGCTKEITDVMGCIFKHSAECVDGVVSPSTDVVDDGKKDGSDNSPVSGGYFVSGPSVVANGVAMLVAAFIMLVVVVA